MALVSERTIHGEGTPERHWAAWARLHDTPGIGIDELVPPGARALVVAPHPDDEVLGTGGLLARLAEIGRTVEIIAVTDGEACHAPTPAQPAVALAQRRRGESAQGWARLGLDAFTVRRCGIADGRIAAAETLLSDSIARSAGTGDVIFCTWRCDGHPDHEAVGRAAARAAAACGSRLVEVPVWMWHWAVPGDRRVPWPRLRRLPLTPAALQRKRDAIAAHRSQLVPGPAGEAPILPGWALDRLLRPNEFFLTAPAPGEST